MENLRDANSPLLFVYFVYVGLGVEEGGED